MAIGALGPQASHLDDLAGLGAPNSNNLSIVQTSLLLNQIFSLIERAFCFFAISILAHAYVNIPTALSGAALDVGVSDPYNRAANLIILAGLAILCVTHRRSCLFIVSRGLAVNVFFLLAVASTLWSLDPEVTSRRVLSLLDAILMAYYLVARFPVERIIHMLATTFMVAAMASAVVALAMPQIGVMHQGELAGDWMGVFPFKQTLGVTMMLGCLCYGWLTIHDRNRRMFHIAGLAICFGVMVMSGSRTSVLGTLLCPVVGQCLRTLRVPGLLRLWLTYFLVLCGATIAILLYNYYDAAMALLDKDPSLTGRVPLWGVLLQLVADRPMLGYGYGAFWLERNTLVQWIWAEIQWTAPEAHNSYIDALLDLGVPGFAATCMILVSVIYRSIGGMWQGYPTWSSFAAVYALNLAVTGFVETGFLHSGDLEAMLVTLVYVGLRLPQPRARRLPVKASMPERRLPARVLANQRLR
jgi:exopolysaccharide production protein ExoQ